MRRRFRQQKGFTLIEMLIAMTIFVTFTGILINSYTDIIRSQRDANSFRLVYSEGRRIFDTFVDEVRNGVIYYSDDMFLNNAVEELTLVSKDGSRVSKFEKNGDNIDFSESIACGVKHSSYALNSEDIRVSELSFYITPAFDPYTKDNVRFDALQFQPKVTIYAKFERDRGDNKAPYTFDLQTTVSSRFYSSVPFIDPTCLISDK